MLPEQSPAVTTKSPARKPRRRPAHTSLDARSWQFKLLQKTKADLLAHAGGKPSITARALIERAAWLTVYVAEMDAKARAGELMSAHASHQYLAWSNSLARTLSRIGFQDAASQTPSLADHIARRAA
jgi:hypothetical protein